MRKLRLYLNGDLPSKNYAQVNVLNDLGPIYDYYTQYTQKSRKPQRIQEANWSIVGVVWDMCLPSSKMKVVQESSSESKSR